MPINAERQPFQSSAINKAPVGSGVFQFLSMGSPIFIGWADSEGVRKKLREHYDGKHGSCTKIATGYACEEHDDPEARCKELLEEYKAKHGTYPRGNLQ